MIDRVPLEIALHILSLVPLTTFAALYQVLPESIVDKALQIQLSSSSSSSSRHSSNKKDLEPYLNLVSTNLCELSAPRPDASCRHKNESWIPLYYAKMDIPNRIIWLFPGFASEQHYFRVEDSYVSHGKLLLRPTPEQLSYGQQQQLQRRSTSKEGKESTGTREGGGKTTLASLWDIRKQLPPTRAGTFSGASEFATQSQLCREMTIERMGCWIDACLLCPSSSDNTIAAESTTSTSTTTTTTTTTKDNSTKTITTAASDPPRPVLPKEYVRRVPARERDPMFMSSRTCGYFLVERVGLSIPSFLGLFFHGVPQQQR